MHTTLNLLETFDPISLREMDAVKLLDRTDIKYIFHRDQLYGMLAPLREQYLSLSIKGSRFSHYETRYLDTDTLEMYTLHHNGKLNRFKVRFRDYIDSGVSYFEVKLKTNTGRTIKDRVKLNDANHLFDAESGNLLQQKTTYLPSMLHQSIQVNYNRITLVNNNLTERLTIDSGLTFIQNNLVYSLPDLVIAEVKQEKTSASPFISLMQTMHLHPLSMSKYCLGIASMVQDIKTNRFKPKMLYINRLCHENA